MKRKLYIFFLIIVAFAFCGSSKITLVDVETAIIEEDYERAKSLAQNIIDKKPLKGELDQALYYLGLSQLHLGLNKIILSYQRKDIILKKSRSGERK